jgi:fibronectin type 3 domain-containing protein
VRGALTLSLLGFLLFASCGYVGPVLPPSPQLPNAVTGLVAIQRGGDILIAFQTPPRTTDSLPVKSLSSIDLRVGPEVPPSPFDFNRWAASARQYPVPAPSLGDPHDPQPAAVSTTIPASDWEGRRVVVAVRTAVKKGEDHYSAWSNRITLNVITPLSPPVITAEATAKGVLLHWPAAAGVKYRVSRQGPTETAPAEVGIAEQGSYLDASSQFDIKYTYTVVALRETAESLASEPVSITPIDKFAPSVPAGLTALVGPGSIELSWQRSPESDLAGYYVYRSVNNSPLQRLGSMTNLPLYSDHAVEAGKAYRYQVSAVDKKNNESDKSPPAEATF